MANKKKKQVEGTLPSSLYLRNNGLDSLRVMMQRYPENFAHIQQNRLRVDFKTVEQWVEIADELVGNNNGILPNQSWLVKNKLSGLAWSIRKYPEAFSHIKQDSRRRTLEESVKLAERLEKEYGELPNQKWLKDNDYYGLAQSIKGQPKRYSHIKQKSKKGRTVDEWIKVAKNLAKENNGILPNYAWLKKNGYYGLAQSILKNSSKGFKGIKQEHRKGVRIIGE